MKKYLMILPAFALMMGISHAEPAGVAMFLHEHGPENEEAETMFHEPFVAVVQNGDQSSMQVLEVPSLKACNTLARVVLYSKIQDQKRMNEELKKTKDGVWSLSYSIASPSEVWCIDAGGYAFSLTPEILAEKDEP